MMTVITYNYNYTLAFRRNMSSMLDISLLKPYTIAHVSDTKEV